MFNEMNSYENKVDKSNILIIGCGGAGLRAAIEAKNSDLIVKVLGKRSKFDSHTVLAAGGINASLSNVDHADSWEQHFADTFLEGYGIGNPHIIERMVKDAAEAVHEIDSWGANFNKLPNGKIDQRFFGAHTYRRTCYSADYTGEAILKALLKKAYSLDIPILDNEYVTDLLIEDKKCLGAMSINTENGSRTVHLSDSTILCTGGHTRIWKKSSSRELENFGDGFFLAAKSGCKLIDMEMVQFHPTGMVMPESIAGTLVTEAVRGEGGKLLNSEGKRFMINYDRERMELSTRDRIAMANYTEILEGRSSPNGGVYLDISHIKKDIILSKLPKIYNQFLEYQGLDISKDPMEVAPTAHYSMGGVKVNSIDHSTEVQGLFAAGEVAGGLHGANRLGGNSLAEILVFGKLSGKAAVEYSNCFSITENKEEVIKKAHENINKRSTESQTSISNSQNKLRQIMWEYCGVVKNKEKLKNALTRLEKLKTFAETNQNNVEKNDHHKLISSFDLEASIFTAEATILSSLMREESRGALQRDDFTKLSEDYNCNFSVSLENKKIKLKEENLIPLEKKLISIISQTKNIDNLKGRLLE